MNKKILFGSIIAVAILVLVSFTGVVGYQTTKSNSGKVSPLFNMRIKRAIGEESKVITCNYISKGDMLPFPKRDDRALLIQKFIDIIVKLEEEEFNKFVDIAIKEIMSNNKVRDDNISKLKLILNYFRDAHSKIIYNDQIPFELTVNPIFCIFYFLYYQLSVLIFLTGFSIFALIYYIIFREWLTSDCIPTMFIPC
ncbi:MAG: hypothetical protein JSW06_02490 [Thermoplasmatales archaeon]|nr:MAG: hypothetical protein JSW06_02490 [Thermoplasmatales archaeon]